MKRKIAIIVGASGSLGTELVRTYLKNKYHVIAITNTHDVDVTSSNITRFKYNLVKEKDYTELVDVLEEEVNKNSEINIIYAPGVYYKVNIEDFDEKKLNENIKINVVGFIHIYKAIFNILKRNPYFRVACNLLYLYIFPPCGIRSIIISVSSLLIISNSEKLLCRLRIVHITMSAPGAIPP